MPNIAVERTIYVGSSLAPQPQQEKPSPRGCHPVAIIAAALHTQIADGGPFAAGRAKSQDASREPADPPEVAALKEKAATAIRQWYGDAAEGENGVLNQPFILVKDVGPGVDGIIFIGPETGKPEPNNPKVTTSETQVALEFDQYKMPVTILQRYYLPRVDRAGSYTTDILYNDETPNILNGTGKDDIGGRTIAGSILIYPTPDMTSMLHKHDNLTKRPSSTFLFVTSVNPPLQPAA